MGWPIKKIGEVCDLMTGGTPSKSKPEYFDGGSIKWLVSGDIHKKEIFDCDGRITEEGLNNSSAKYLPKNSVLIALNGQGKTRGTVALLRTEATCNQSLVSINPKNSSELLPEFLFMYLHGNYEKIRTMTGDGGNDRRGLNMPLIRSIEIPIAPLSEQKRIVAILDKAFAAIDEAKAKTEQNLINARELFDIYLQQVFSQDGEGYHEIRWGDTCDFTRGPFGGSLKKSMFVESGYAVYEQKHAIHDHIEQIRYFINQQKFDEMRRFEVKPGDLIMSCSGVTLGRVSIIPEGAPRGIINQALLKLSPKENINRHYLKYWIRSKIFQDIIFAHSGGAAIPNVPSAKILKDIRLNVPDLEKQQKLVDDINDISQKTEKLRLIYKRKLAHLEELKKSLLQKVFSGELTANQAEEEVA